MKTLLVGNTKSYESQRLKEEFKKKDLEFQMLPIQKLVVGVESNVPSLTTIYNENLKDYDTYLFRGYGKNVWEAIIFAREVYALGKCVIEEKLATQRYVMSKIPYTLSINNIPVIDTKVIFSLSDEILSSLEFPLIIRSTIGARGEGIFKANNIEEFKKYYTEIGPKVLIQPYIPIKFDYRVFIVGEKILGVMKKYNSEENFVTNISSGGRAEASELPQEILDTCMRAKKASNVEIAGVDVIVHEDKHYVLEVNAAPQFEGFESCTGINVAGEIVEYALNKFHSKI